MVVNSQEVDVIEVWSRYKGMHLAEYRDERLDILMDMIRNEAQSISAFQNAWLVVGFMQGGF